MSTATLNNLLEYLYGTLSPDNMRWVGEHLIEHARKEEQSELKPYTIEELHARITESERQFATGQFQDFDEAMDEIEAELFWDCRREPQALASQVR